MRAEGRDEALFWRSGTQRPGPGPGWPWGGAASQSSGERALQPDKQELADR